MPPLPLPRLPSYSWACSALSVWETVIHLERIRLSSLLWTISFTWDPQSWWEKNSYFINLLLKLSISFNYEGIMQAINCQQKQSNIIMCHDSKYRNLWIPLTLLRCLNCDVEPAATSAFSYLIMRYECHSIASLFVKDLNLAVVAQASNPEAKVRGLLVWGWSRHFSKNLPPNQIREEGRTKGGGAGHVVLWRRTCLGHTRQVWSLTRWHIHLVTEFNILVSLGILSIYFT